MKGGVRKGAAFCFGEGSKRTLAMDERKSADQRPRLRRTIVLCTICVGASGLGLILAHPIAAQFRMSSPWVLPAIAAGVLLVLVTIALLVLPRITSRRS